MKCALTEAVGQQTTSNEGTPAKKPRQITDDVENGAAAECPGLDNTPPFDTPAPHTQGTNPVTIWQGKMLCSLMYDTAYIMMHQRGTRHNYSSMY